MIVSLIHGLLPAALGLLEPFYSECGNLIPVVLVLGIGIPTLVDVFVLFQETEASDLCDDE
jgi:hypothetical protein